MSAYIYVEGGGTGAQSKEVDIRCREGFRKLLEKCDFEGRMPRLVACSGRDAAFDLFKTALALYTVKSFVGLWIDSEEPLGDLEATWKHLWARDKWAQPAGATDERFCS